MGRRALLAFAIAAVLSLALLGLLLTASRRLRGLVPTTAAAQPIP